MSGRKLPPRVSSNDSSFMSPTRSSPISLLGAPSKPRVSRQRSVSDVWNTARHLPFSPPPPNQKSIKQTVAALKRRDRLSAKAVKFAKNREKMSDLADRKAIRMATRSLRWADNRVGKGAGKGSCKDVDKRAVKMAKKELRKAQRKYGQGN